MDLGLEGLLLTRLPSSFTSVDVPYSGEDEFGPVRDARVWGSPGPPLI